MMTPEHATTAPARISVIGPSGTVAHLHEGEPANVFVSNGWVHAEQGGYWRSYPAERVFFIEWIKTEAPPS